MPILFIHAQVTQNQDGTTSVTPAFSDLPSGSTTADYSKINVAFQFLGPNIFPFNASAQAALLIALNDTFTAANVTHELAVTATTVRVFAGVNNGVARRVYLTFVSSSALN